MWEGEIFVNTEFEWLVEVFKEGLSLETNPGYIIDEILPLNKYKLVDVTVDECGNSGYLINEQQDVNKIISIAVDECSNIYLLDGNSNQILLFNVQKKTINPLKCLNKKLKSIKKFKTLKTIVISSDTLYVADDELVVGFARVNGQLRSVNRISDLDEKVPMNTGKLPTEINLTQLGVKISGFTHGLDDNYYLIIDNNTGNDIVRLKFVENRYLPTRSTVKVFDSSKTDCKWHRLELNANIPEKTHVDVYYHISNDKKSDQNVTWTKLVTFQSGVDLYDVLIPNVPGKLIWIKMDLVSTDEYKTPIIKHLKVYFPRISYLRYLPAVYQEDELGKEFLEPFLSLFETFMWKKEEQINNISSYFDADSTPDEFLNWLGSWTSTIFDESWSLNKKRMFLKNAVKLYKKRGTKEGLEELLEIYTGNKPIIVENWQLYGDETNCQSPLKCKCNINNQNPVSNDENNSSLFGKAAPFHFCVISIPYLFTIDSSGLNKLKEGPISDELKNQLLKKGIQISDGAEISFLRGNEWLIKDKENLLLLEFEASFKVYKKPLIDLETLLKTSMRLIDREKPAHTTAGVVILQPWTYLGMHTYLGVNSFLSKNEMRLGTGSAINRDTLLAEKENSGQLNFKSRVEIDTKLS